MKKTFTLIELLVVVAIIGILASMLLPALARSKASAKQALCLNNLKQIHLWTSLYADDNDGFAPPASDEANIPWDDKLSVFDGRRLSPAEILNNTAPARPENVSYKCPLDGRSFAGTSIRTYSINRELGDVEEDYASVSLDNLPSPSATVLMSEKIPNNANIRDNRLGYWGSCNGFQTGDKLATDFKSYHPRRSDYPWLFADGHLEIRDKGSFISFAPPQ
ncbi:MAG: hypothetical protein RL095_766 [Verrucomicrobiota bacterium]|jgi:prepilin-type N-terminal cleavage/methylation domain-containing protein